MVLSFAAPAASGLERPGGKAVGDEAKSLPRRAPRRRSCPRAPERGRHRLKAALEAVIAGDRRNNRSLPLKPRYLGRQHLPERVNNPPDAAHNRGSWIRCIGQAADPASPAKRDLSSFPAPNADLIGAAEIPRPWRPEGPSRLGAAAGREPRAQTTPRMRTRGFFVFSSWLRGRLAASAAEGGPTDRLRVSGGRPWAP